MPSAFARIAGQHARTGGSGAAGTLPREPTGGRQVIFQGGGFDETDRPDGGEMGRFFGPTQVDHTIRQAVQFCWMALPPDQRSIDEVERQIRRIVDRALRDLREDGEAFGPTPGGP
jgi:hypothetical protein